MNMVPRKFYLDSIFDDLAKRESNIMKCDIYEKDNIYYIEAEIPGYQKPEIKIECDNGYLTIKAEKSEETTNEEINYIKRERFYGSVQREFYVGKVDSDNIKAEFANGMLKIIVPKENKEKNKKIIEID
ncbi:MAG: Hsp20/alpha crystallin family protein [Bacilli bacterium]|nr:Hsp20/alpha crystallin family protein [Bacilli bacterium]